MNSNLLFVPLDSRPCCFTFVQRLAEFRNIQLLVPPREILGNLECRGQLDQLWAWLKQQKTDYPAILSADMLLWGGLVGSRRPGDICEEIRQDLRDYIAFLCSRENTYAFSTIMRTAPTQKTTADIEEAEMLVKASQLLASHYNSLDELKEAFADNSAQDYLCSRGIQIPNQVWRDYLRQRQQKNMAHISLLKSWPRDAQESYLLFGYDDSQAKGINLLEGAWLQSMASECDNIGVTTGADELAQLLLARLAAPGQTIGVVWDREETQAMITRYEDCSLAEVLQRQARVTKTSFASQDEAEICDKVLFIWGPKVNAQEESFFQRDEHWPAIPDSCKDFFDKMEEALELGQSVVLADVAYANGGDCSLIKHLLDRGMLTRLSGYAGWNTSGNTLGTALATTLMLPETVNRTSFLAYKRFMIERILDDCVYESIVRPQLIKAMGGSFRLLSERETEVLQKRIKDRMWHIFKLYTEKMSLHVGIKDISITLPWRRLFEAEISVEVDDRQ